jgi:hypothetical protein
MMREDVELDADGVTLRGWLYIPDGTSGAAPAVVIAPGFSAVKEMHVDRFAEVFADAGLVALVYDNRNFGASDGEPRQEVDPWAHLRDYRTAITYAATRPEVDAERIGEYESGSYLPWISPTPLLMCVAENDVVAPIDIAVRGYATDNEPKKLAILPGGHFDSRHIELGSADAGLRPVTLRP